MLRLDEERIEELRKSLIKKLKQYDGKEKVSIKFKEVKLEDLIFVYTEKNKKEFAFDIRLIEKLDLTGVSFDDFKCSGINFFKLKGVSINPQKVYNKDLSSSNFNGVTFTDTLDGCEVFGASFYGSKGAKVDPRTVKDKQWLCVDCSDVTFTAPFDGCEINMTDFDGSEGAIIDPSTLSNREFCSCIFKGVEFIGEIDGFLLRTSDFEGSKGAVINVETCHLDTSSQTKDLILADTTLKGSWDGKVLYGINFKGSEGAIINPQSLKSKVLTRCTFEGVTFIEPLDGCTINNSNFTNSIGAEMLEGTVEGLHTVLGLEFIKLKTEQEIFDEEKQNIEEAFKLVKQRGTSKK